MAEKKVGILIREARTAARLTQEKLASAVGENLTAAMISKCERGDADLTNAQLKKIAVACGVTQASLLNAPKNLAETAPASKKAAAAKTATAAKKTAAAAKTATASKKTAAAKKTAASSKTSTAAKTSAASKTPAGATSSMKVTASEKKLVEAYREASSDLKKIALKVLKGEYGDTVNSLLGAASGSSGIPEGIGSVLGDVIGGLFSGKK